MSDGYEIAHIDELEALPINGGEFVWRPVRRRFGITAFGTNVYTGDEGARVIEEHRERDNHEEMYVVLRGSATFTLDEEHVPAPAGTLVFIRPGTLRTAFADEDGTAILAVGAKPGVVFEPSPWEDVFAAYSYAERGDLERGRTVVREAISKLPDAWQGYYNAACMEARFGDPDEAVALLARSFEAGGDEPKKIAASDKDFDAIRDRADFPG
ncbi:MAG: TPR end-of-group domain-containing protein [Gaiellaceae bacterium]